MADDIVRIPLTQGQSALVDAADLPMLQQYRWWAAWSPRSSTYYAMTRIPMPNGIERTVQMHRLIMGEPAGLQVDHKNWDTLNNTRQNLRAIPQAQNKQHNQGYRNKITGFIGVSVKSVYVGNALEQRTRQRRYQATIPDALGNLETIGVYNTAEEAARARDAEALIRFGDWSRFNFPNEERRRLAAEQRASIVYQQPANRSDNTSGYRGVTQDARVKHQDIWFAQITVDNYARRLGSFASAEQAAHAYDIAAREAFGPTARLNFPDNIVESVQTTPVVLRVNNTSGYRGVVFDKRSGAWVAHFTENGRQRYLGTFSTADLAARAYDAAAQTRPNPILNFPGEDSVITPMALPRNNTTGFRGVRQQPNGKWRAQLRTNGRFVSLSTFATAEEAAHAYDAAARDAFGSDARLNFPDS